VRYASPEAFRTALEARIRRRALERRQPIARVRQLLVFDRFLARIFAVLGARAIVEGGAALELRLERARTTRDIDLRVSARPDDLLAMFRAVCAHELDDFLTFVIDLDPEHPEIAGDGMVYGGRRYRAEARLAGKIYGERFGVDAGFGDILTTEPELIRAPDYEPETALLEVGVTPILHYDPLDRLVETELSDGTRARVAFDAWTRTEHDGNDLVLGSPWEARMRQLAEAEDRPSPALAKPHAHARSVAAKLSQSPTTVHLDALGREVVRVADNRARDANGEPVPVTDRESARTLLVSRAVLDIAGNALAMIDPRGELRREQGVAVDSAAYALQRFDRLGRRYRLDSVDAGTKHVLRFHDGSIQRTRYNEAGFVETIDVDIDGGDRPVVSDVDYNARGQRTLVEYAGGTFTSRLSYDPLSFLETLSTIRADGEILQHLEYRYDAAGNITSILDRAAQGHVPGHELAAPHRYFEYDALYQLIEATGRAIPRYGPDVGDDPRDAQGLRRYIERYEYDVSGNLRERAFRIDVSLGLRQGFTQRFEVEAGQLPTRPDVFSNRLVATESTPHPADAPERRGYGYDRAGNLLNLGISELAWSPEHRLGAYRRTGVVAFYAYDATGERARKTIELNSARRDRLYFGDYELYREWQANELDFERTTLNVSDGERRVVLVEHESRGAPRLRFQLGDHLDTISLEVDGSGARITYEEFLPYGETALFVPLRDVPRKRYRYTARERDDESGLHYHSARYLAPWLGRWCSADPAEFVDGGNLFAYASSKVITTRDVSGLNNTQVIRSIARRHSGPEAMAQLFTDERINDGAGSVRARAVSVIRANAANFTFEQFHVRFRQRGFRTEIRDPVPTNNQVGHALSALALALLPETVNERVPYTGRRTLRSLVETDRSVTDDEVAMRIVIGHELFPDHGELELPAWGRGVLAVIASGMNDSDNPTAGDFGGDTSPPAPSPGEAALAPLIEGYRRVTNEHLAAFRSAVESIVAAGPDGDVDYDVLVRTLAPITADITAGDGNSAQDLANSAANYALGRLIAEGRFADREQVAAWIRRNEAE
jgi:RHS repeat-associated protein